MFDFFFCCPLLVVRHSFYRRTVLSPARSCSFPPFAERVRLLSLARSHARLLSLTHGVLRGSSLRWWFKIAYVCGFCWCCCFFSARTSVFFPPKKKGKKKPPVAQFGWWKNGVSPWAAECACVSLCAGLWCGAHNSRVLSGEFSRLGVSLVDSAAVQTRSVAVPGPVKHIHNAGNTAAAASLLSMLVTREPNDCALPSQCTRKRRSRTKYTYTHAHASKRTHTQTHTGSARGATRIEREREKLAQRFCSAAHEKGFASG